MPVVSRSLLIPVVAVAWAALAIAAALERRGPGGRRPRRRQVQLAAALATIEHQRRFSDAILDTVDVGLVLLDADGTYRAMNRRHQAFMRLAYPDGHAGRAGQLGHVYAADGTTPLAREEMPTYRASQGEEFDDCRIWIGEDPLTSRALSVSARAVRDEDGTFTGAALAYKDVTDFMRALRVKDEFVASVSHELRTPLTSIVGLRRILLQEREDLAAGRAHASSSVVARNTDRLHRLVADLLHTAQVGRGADARGPHAAPTWPQIVRDAALAATPDRRGAPGIDLEVEAPERLRAAGRRAADGAGRRQPGLERDQVHAPAAARSASGSRVDGNRVELAVSDTGIGIEAADRDRLFTRFFRARHAEEQSIQGVGLGLSITKSIVESHGGRIEVDSEIGRGSTFRVRLPLDVSSRPAAAVSGSRGQVPKISRVWLTSAYPCSAAIARVQRSTAGPSTSTVAPQRAADQVVVVACRSSAGRSPRRPRCAAGRPRRPRRAAAGSGRRWPGRRSRRAARAARGSPARSGSRRTSARASTTARRWRVGRRPGRRAQCSS